MAVYWGSSHFQTHNFLLVGQCPLVAMIHFRWWSIASFLHERCHDTRTFSRVPQPKSFAVDWQSHKDTTHLQENQANFLEETALFESPRWRVPSPLFHYPKYLKVPSGNCSPMRLVVAGASQSSLGIFGGVSMESPGEDENSWDGWDECGFILPRFCKITFGPSPRGRFCSSVIILYFSMAKNGLTNQKTILKVAGGEVSATRIGIPLQ